MPKPSLCSATGTEDWGTSTVQTDQVIKITLLLDIECLILCQRGTVHQVRDRTVMTKWLSTTFLFSDTLRKW